ncbi:hypothetical protein D6T63_05085 [Arthrobacter cheniae]|uniref:Aquaporin Z n=1 Tax=Arthrobacter cheniae TaxID=1258888 RepID=A0A3A5MHJ6_9MICC|nr:aquaporin [Arthrobacter cheniae]RJT82106.1 hypothetical protein D6T63_05085 [Arthrobacter cheniae]
MTHPTTATGSTPDSAPMTSGDDGPQASGLVARSIAEAVGSFFIILVGLGATMLATETSLQPTLVFGFAVVAAMIAFGYISGGHFNPAVTLGSAIAGRTGWASVVPYIVAQVLGAVAASGLIWLVLSANSQLTGIRTFFSSASNGFGEHSPAQFPLTSAFLLEVTATAILVAVFLGAGSRRARRDLAPFAVGLAFAGLLSFLLPVTNGALNPIRATASAIFADSWALQQLWLFWAAPIIGGVIAGLVFRTVDSWEPARAGRGTVDAPVSAPADPAAGEGSSESMTTEPSRHGSPAARDTPGGTAAGDRVVQGDERRGRDAATFFETRDTDAREATRMDDPNAPGTGR